MDNDGKKYISNEELREYLSTLQVEPKDALEFLSRDSKTEGPAFDYIRRLIVSQLHVRDHVEYLYGTVGICDKAYHEIVQMKSPILGSILYNYDKYFKKLQDVELKAKHKSKPELYPGREEDIRQYLESKVHSRRTFITDYFLIIPSKIRVVLRMLDEIPEIEKRKKLEEKLESLIAELQENKTRVMAETHYDDVFSVELRHIIDERWKEFLKDSRGELQQYIEGCYALIADKLPIKDMEELFRRTDYMTYNYFVGRVREISCIEKLRTDIVTNLNILKSIYEHCGEDKTLLEAINLIRNEFCKNGLQNSRITTYYKTNETTGESKLLQNTAHPNEVPEKMEELSKRYEATKKIQDRDQYMKAVAEIVEDFVVIHPYSDGNGRTSRYLLASMLLDRGITPPILYPVYDDRRVWDYTMDADLEARESDPIGYNSKIVEKIKDLSGVLPKSIPYKTVEGKSSFNLEEYMDGIARAEIEEEMSRHYISKDELQGNFNKTKPEARKTIFARMKQAFLGLNKDKKHTKQR